jgi:hypothetical protein
MRGHGV